MYNSDKIELLVELQNAAHERIRQCKGKQTKAIYMCIATVLMDAENKIRKKENEKN